MKERIAVLRAADSPAADWSVERRLEYVGWAKAVVAGLRGTSPWLEGQFDEAAERAIRSFDPMVAMPLRATNIER
jgi:hypothetical protein